MDLDELESRVSDKTKAIVINSPHNPTGGVLTQEDLERIAELAQKLRFHRDRRRNLQPQLLFRQRIRFDRVAAGMRERTIVVDGFSKAYAMTGWRWVRDHAPKISRKP